MKLVISRAAARRKYVLVAVTAVILAGLAGCASGPNANPRDPLEPLNRRMMEFNEGLDAMALKPAATAYKDFVPPIVRTGVNNFFSNPGDVWSGVNSALQLKLGAAGEDFLRFGFNTFFGFGGVMDIASELNVERHREDLGQTLGHWGVPPGPYLMLPFFGPSTLRDALALPFDRRGDPLYHVHNLDTRWSLYILRAVDQRSNLLRATSVLSEAALDKYSFTRDAYLQRHRAEIFDDRPSDKDGQEPRPDGKDGASHPSDDGYIPPEPEDTPVPAPTPVR